MSLVNWINRRSVSQLKTRQLMLLMNLAEEKSILAAAKASGMTQPAASKLLSDLERALGVSLFSRHARGVNPTPYGEIMVRQAYAALAAMGHAYSEIEALQSGIGGLAAIGSIHNPATNLVITAITNFKKNNPFIQVKVFMDVSKNLVRDLTQGQLDMVVGRLSSPADARYMNFEPICDESHNLICRAKHPLAKKKGLELADLMSLPWIFPQRESILRERLESMFIKRGLVLPLNIIEARDLPVIVNLLHASDAVVALPKEMVEIYCQAKILTVLPVDLDVHMEPYGIITHRDNVLSQGSAALLKELRDCARRYQKKT